MTTLTYDPTEYQESELSTEEQDSLAVGERLEQEQQQLLAGKFRDAEELENAYIELQRKLGSRDPEQTSEQPTEQEQEVEEAPDTAFLDRLWEESKGEYSDETLKELQGMDPADLAQMYLDYRHKQEEKSQPTPTLEPGDIDTLKGIPGGPQQYDSMMGWAAENLSEQEIQMYDTVMERGDPLACFFAVQALTARFQDSYGKEGQMLTGKSSDSRRPAFRSQAELVRAMADPRYDKDPAYRQDVISMLENSPELQF